MHVCVCVTILIKEELINLRGSEGEQGIERESARNDTNDINTVPMYEILQNLSKKERERE